MTTSQLTDIRPLRLWPGIALAAMQCTGLLVPLLLPDQGIFGVLAAVVGALLILVWWMLFSRALWLERIGTLALMVVAVLVTSRFVHISIAGAGMGMMFYVLSPTVMAFTLVLGVLAGRRLTTGP